MRQTGDKNLNKQNAIDLAKFMRSKMRGDLFEHAIKAWWNKWKFHVIANSVLREVELGKNKNKINELAKKWFSYILGEPYGQSSHIKTRKLSIVVSIECRKIFSEWFVDND